MQEFGLSQDASQDDRTKSKSSTRTRNTARVVSLKRERVWRPTTTGQRRRHGLSGLSQWAYLLLAALGVLLLSACDLPGTSGNSTGTQRASAAGPARTPTAPQADGPSAIYIGVNTGVNTINQNDAASSSVVALNPADGSVLWRSTTFSGQMGSLHQVHGILLAPLTSGSLVALSAQDGKELWHTDALTSSPNAGAPKLYGDANAIFVVRDTRVEAYQVTDGTLLWHHDFAGGDCDHPDNLAAGAGIVVLSTLGCVPNIRYVALSERDGSVLWQSPSGFDIGAGVAIANGTVYTDSGGKVTALNAATGAMKWQYTPAQLAGMGGSSVSVSDQFVIAEAGMTIFALRSQDGSLAWSVDFPDFIYGGHIAARNVLYVSDDNGTITALRLSDGVRLWQNSLSFRDVGTPVAAGATLYVDDYRQPVPPNGTEAEKLYALQMSDGSESWHYTIDPGSFTLPAVVG